MSTSSQQIVSMCLWAWVVILASTFTICRSKETACICPLDLVYQPVCGSDGKTYGNECQLNCHNRETGQCVYMVHKGACAPTCWDDFPCNCPRIFAPVCGSNGVTYPNECELNCHNRKTGDDVYVVHEGRCTCSGENSCFCPRIYAPVCGSNGVTYGNECQLNCHNRKTGDAVYVVHDGPCSCQPSDDCVCTADYRPVCGSDGKTYSNLCRLNCHNKENCDDVTVAYYGECQKKAQKKLY